MTEWYESFDPEYLRNAAAATDAIMRRLAQLTKRALWSPVSVVGTGLSVVQGGQAAEAAPEPKSGEK